MTRWMVVEDMFMASSGIVKKGYIYESEAQEYADYLNSNCDAYTSYRVEAYQTENVINVGKIKLK